MSTGALHGRIAIITGASRGIGAGIARAFASSGADLTLIARDRTALEALGDELRAGGASVRLLPGDLGDAADTRRLAAKAQEEAIDILVNNAGVSYPESALKTTLEHWEQTFAVNVRAAYLLAQALAPGMMARGWGRVVNISSQSGLVALPDHLAYCASKGALEMMSKVMALEWAPAGVTVNCIAPTVINTPMAEMAFPTEEARARMLAQIPVGRFGEVEEVARLVCFLASQDAAMITGDSIRLDGGWTVK